MRPLDLIDSYEKALYEVFGYGYLKPGHSSKDIDQLLRSKGCATGCLITPVNPMSQPQPMDVQRKRIRQFLKSHPEAIRGENNSPDKDPKWSEPSFFLPGIDKNEALSLAETWGQSACIFYSIENGASILWT